MCIIVFFYGFLSSLDGGSVRRFSPPRLLRVPSLVKETPSCQISASVTLDQMESKSPTHDTKLFSPKENLR